MSSTGRARNTTCEAAAAAPELFEQFPLPLAVFGDDGELEGNERFRRLWSSRLLRIDQLRDIVREPRAGWRTVHAFDPSGAQRSLKAQAFRLDGRDMLVFDEAGEASLRRKVHELEAEVSELKRLSSTDVLTGVWNRAHFEQAAETERARSIRQRQPVSLVLIDVDHFKRVNDTHGHQAGDVVLREFARVIRGAIRSIDGLYRWGGEEFVVIATATGYRAAGVLSERIRHTIGQHEFSFVGKMTVSLGVAEHLFSESNRSWFRRLDRALYRAKEGGRDRVFVDARGSSDGWMEESSRSVVRLIWRDEFACGEQTIDQQHRQLFDLANAAIEASMSEDASNSAIETAVDRLIAHIVEHFDYEERAIAARHFTGAEDHKRLHQALVGRAIDLKAAVSDGRATTTELLDFIVGKVVANHMFAADREFYPLFQSD